VNIPWFKIHIITKPQNPKTPLRSILRSRLRMK